jgi:hypothetical protein
MSQEQDAVWSQILKLLDPRDAAAYLDWGSGITRVNATIAQWDAALSRSDDSQLSLSERQLLETVTHETAHFLQIATTGYLYRFAVFLSLELRGMVEDMGRAGGLPEADWMGSLLAAPIPAQGAKSLRELVGEIDDPGPEGITTRAIVESGAFLVQKRAFWPDISPAAYRDVLDHQSPSHLYRSAYDVAGKWLGDESLDAYPYLAYLALCTSQPPTSFVALCQAVAERSLAKNGVLRVGAIAQLLNDSRWRVFGTASEVASWFPPVHPVYTPPVKRLDELPTEGELSLQVYTVTPHILTEQLLRQGMRPMVFNDKSGSYEIAVPPWLWPDMSYAQKKGEVTNLIALAALGTKILSGSA